MRLPRAAGVLLHPTSLPGPHGSGDFGPAAHHFVDWLAQARQRLWQVLPLGHVGPGNSPYMSPSAFAGNPLLVDLGDLQRHGWLTVDETVADTAFDAHRVHYERVVPWRLARLRRAAARFADHADAAMQREFDDFCARHAAWLDDFALFMAIDEHEGGRPWCDWPAPLARRDPGALREARAALSASVQFHRFVQWRFFAQWAALRAHANGRGVRLFGDAPIFVAHHSADVWSHPQLFELDAHGRPSVVAGVPPDYFSATGQRWGNPLYRWSAHAAEGWRWWTERLRSLLEVVDLVRIDHFRGFAAHWEIPADEPTAIHGRWVPGPGEALFDAMTRALGPLPIVAEDLGLITPDVEVLRKRVALPGMRVLHFAFGDDHRNRYLPHHHEPDSVVYTGTHDNDTTLGWWSGAGAHDREHLKAYFGIEARDAAEVNAALMRAALASVADTAILPMQDVLDLGPEHRMNRPGEGGTNWEWRFDWSMVRPEHGARLAALTQLYGRAA